MGRRRPPQLEGTGLPAGRGQGQRLRAQAKASRREKRGSEGAGEGGGKQPMEKVRRPGRGQGNWRGPAQRYVVGVTMFTNPPPRFTAGVNLCHEPPLPPKVCAKVPGVTPSAGGPRHDAGDAGGPSRYHRRDHRCFDREGNDVPLRFLLKKNGFKSMLGGTLWRGRGRDSSRAAPSRTRTEVTRK